MERTSAADLIKTWARDFRAGELTVEDIQDRFANLELADDGLALPLHRRLAEAQRELDSIRFGMCESGQRAEIGRIFLELEQVIANIGPESQSRVEP